MTLLQVDRQRKGDDFRSTGPVVVITVTYGKRIELLRRMVAGSCIAGAERLVIVGNGIDERYRREIEALRRDAGVPIDLVLLAQNLGSASGFGSGLHYALEHYPDAFFWLLDDDNCPRPDALLQLRSAFREATAGGAERVALCSLRLDRTRFVNAAMTGDGEAAFARRSAVASFDIRRLSDKIRRRRGTASALRGEDVRSCDPVALPWAPYGGFFIHGRLAQDLGLPDERFVLYGDDLEWTHRLVRHGGTVLLVPASLIDDLEAEWTLTQATRQRFFVFDLLRSASPTRLYFSIRNDVYFKTRYWSDSLLFLALNAIGFALVTLTLGIATRQTHNAIIILRAMRDGFAGRMDGRLSGI
jgi:GT2 family glycosyltransferase